MTQPTATRPARRSPTPEGSSLRTRTPLHRTVDKAQARTRHPTGQPPPPPRFAWLPKPATVIGRAHPTTRAAPAVDLDGPDADDEVLAPASWTSGGIIGVVAALNVVGLVMVLSASSVVALRGSDPAWYYLARQSVWVTLGTVAMVGCSRIGVDRWRRYGPLLLGASILGMLLVFVPGLGVTVSGSTRWLGAGPFQVQPSEAAKLALGIYCADLLTRRQDRLWDWRSVLLPVGLWTGLVLAIVMAQPDMGTASCIALVVAGILFVGGVPLRLLGRLLGGVALLAGALAWAEPYRRDRLLSFRHPFEQYADKGFQLSQSLMGIGSGGATGVGLGQSRAKWGFLPNAHTDFIFAIVGEETGLVGSLFVVGLFLVLAWLGVRASARAVDRFSQLLAAGLTTWLVGQAVINIGAVIGVLPVTGVPLPFVSFGGSALVISMGAAGILAGIARSGDRARAALVAA